MHCLEGTYILNIPHFCHLNSGRRDTVHRTQRMQHSGARGSNSSLEDGHICVATYLPDSSEIGNVVIAAAILPKSSVPCWQRDSGSYILNLFKLDCSHIKYTG